MFLVLGPSGKTKRFDASVHKTSEMKEVQTLPHCQRDDWKPCKVASRTGNISPRFCEFEERERRNFYELKPQKTKKKTLKWHRGVMTENPLNMTPPAAACRCLWKHTASMLEFQTCTKVLERRNWGLFSFFFGSWSRFIHPRHQTLAGTLRRTPCQPLDRGAVIKCPDRKCVCVCQLDEPQITHAWRYGPWLMSDLAGNCSAYIPPVSPLLLPCPRIKYSTPEFISVRVALQEFRSADVYIDYRAKAPGAISNSVSGPAEDVSRKQ